MNGAKHFDFTELCGNAVLRSAITQIGNECTTPDGQYFDTINYFVTAAMNRYLRCAPSAAAALSATTVRAVAKVMAYSADP